MTTMYIDVLIKAILIWILDFSLLRGWQICKASSDHCSKEIINKKKRYSRVSRLSNARYIVYYHQNKPLDGATNSNGAGAIYFN